MKRGIERRNELGKEDTMEQKMKKGTAKVERMEQR